MRGWIAGIATLAVLVAVSTLWAGDKSVGKDGVSAPKVAENVSPEPATAFKELLGMQTDWAGKITIDKREVTVSRLKIEAIEYCQSCKIPCLWFSFKFVGDYKIPGLGGFAWGWTNPPQNTIRVQSKFHGSWQVTTYAGCELAMLRWEKQRRPDNTEAREFVLGFWKDNHMTGSETATKWRGSATIKDKCLEGSISGEGIPHIKFSLSPIPRDASGKK